MCALCQAFNYDINTNDTVYSWRPGSGSTYINGKASFVAESVKILGSVPDGGGIDTYDLSAYKTNLQISLIPDQSSFFSERQLVDAGSDDVPQANIFNRSPDAADTRYLIENAIGGSGNDKIKGNFTGNELIGNEGADHLVGGGGSDRLFGGSGADRLSGGRGDDVLLGGDGKDQFYFAAGDATGSDVIGDFERGKDKIVLNGIERDVLLETLNGATHNGGDVILTFGDDFSIRAADLAAADLSMSDFVLV